MPPKKRKLDSRAKSMKDWRAVCEGAKKERHQSLIDVDKELVSRLSVSRNHVLVPGVDRQGKGRELNQFVGGVIGDTDFMITELDFETLVESLSLGQLSTSQVVNAYLRRAIVSQHVVRDYI
jgi:hypothetical protein